MGQGQVERGDPIGIALVEFILKHKRQFWLGAALLLAFALRVYVRTPREDACNQLKDLLMGVTATTMDDRGRRANFSNLPHIFEGVVHGRHRPPRRMKMARRYG